MSSEENDSISPASEKEFNTKDDITSYAETQTKIGGVIILMSIILFAGSIGALAATEYLGLDSSNATLNDIVHTLLGAVVGTMVAATAFFFRNRSGA